MVLVRLGKRRTITIPKEIAEKLNLKEGKPLRLEVRDGNEIVLIPVEDPIDLALYGEKFAKVTLKELEEESVNEQKRYIG